MHTDKLLKALVIVGVPAALICVVYWALLVKQPLPCFLYAISGLYCPTCGATRAVIALLSGDFIRAIGCNLPVAVLFFPTVIAVLILYFRFLIKRRAEISRGMLYSLIIIVTIFIIFGIVRNIPAEPFIFLNPM